MGQYDLAIGDDDGLSGDESEMAGDDDLSGDDDFGGRRKPARRAAPARPSNDLTQVFNFPQGPAGAALFTTGLTGILTGRPQRAFRTERLVIPSTTSPYFIILDLVIGRESMFVNSEAASAEIFSQSGVGVQLRGFAARPGIDISMTVKNIHTDSHAFYGSIIGPAK